MPYQKLTVSGALVEYKNNCFRRTVRISKCLTVIRSTGRISNITP
jgi:hypothetical protein